MMAWTEAETSNHCQLFAVLLHDSVFNKIIDKLIVTFLNFVNVTKKHVLEHVIGKSLTRWSAWLPLISMVMRQKGQKSGPGV